MRQSTFALSLILLRAFWEDMIKSVCHICYDGEGVDLVCHLSLREIRLSVHLCQYVLQSAPQADLRIMSSILPLDVCKQVPQKPVLL